MHSEAKQLESAPISLPDEKDHKAGTLLSNNAVFQACKKAVIANTSSLGNCLLF